MSADGDSASADADAVFPLPSAATAMVPSPDLEPPTLSGMSEFADSLSTAQRDEFSKYVAQTPGPHLISAIFRGARRQLFRQFCSKITKIEQRLKSELTASVLTRADDVASYDRLLLQIQSERRYIRPRRRTFYLMCVLRRKSMKLERLRTAMLRSNIERTVLFVDYLRGFEDADGLPPSVDLDGFLRSFEVPSAKMQRLQDEVARLAAAAPEVPELELSSWYFRAIHPSSTTGSIIAELEDRDYDVNYGDVAYSLDRLTDDDNFQKLEDLMFDLAWQRRPFPFGAASEATLPQIHNLFPLAVSSSEFLDPEYGLVPFSQLNGLYWPFRHATDMFFEMMIVTNPFDSARAFWSITQDIGDPLRAMMARHATSDGQVEIGFDELFAVLLVCVFAFGVGEWLQVAMYTVSFAEWVRGDAELQFAMTYLESLVTHIVGMDTAAITQVAEKIREEQAEKR